MLREVYAQLPRLACRGLCQHSCGHIGAHRVEIEAMERRGGPFVFHVSTQRCGYLAESGRCRVYEDRPLMCRAFGVVSEMRCPFGCEPAWVATSEEQARWFADLAAINRGPDGELAREVL